VEPRRDTGAGSYEEVAAEPSGPAYMVKNRLQDRDHAVHAWYRFVLGYPPHLVREYLHKLDADPDSDWVLDPFCGTATTPVEARLQGFRTVSVEANPICVLASRVKLNWEVDRQAAAERLARVLALSAAYLASAGLGPMPAGPRQKPLFGGLGVLTAPAADSASRRPLDVSSVLPPAARKLIPRGFISERPLLRVLALRCALEHSVAPGPERDLLTLALANTIVSTAGNVGFGPEVYRLPPKDDADVLPAFSDAAHAMLNDLARIETSVPRPYPQAHVRCGDARDLDCLKQDARAGVVITSPPYPNEKDYTRSTRLESVLLGFLSNRNDLRRVKSGLLRSNTRNVFVSDDDEAFVDDVPSVVRVAQRIEKTREELGKTSGFERLYHKVTRHYFGGMYRHFKALFQRLRPGARCAYVVGDQMSYFRVHIETARLLADVAVKAGYKVEGIELWRTRWSTVTKMGLDENVLVLRRP
jgi:hypothetical protein